MTAEPVPEGRQPVPDALTAVGPGLAPSGRGGLAHPSAGTVLHRVLAASARTFLLNDLGTEFTDDDSKWSETVDSLNIRTGPRPLWAQTAATAPEQAQRRPTETERIHQSRVAMRRIRSNLRTFRLAVDPSWGTALRAELAWYGRCLGGSRDLHIIRDVVVTRGPGVIGPTRSSASSRWCRRAWPTPWPTSPSTRGAPVASS